ncbi:MAG TPA: chemotaxis protein CheW [Gammaproteobacteria bacterium]|jgi:chemotaxis signal transduction protein|nr:chemotaxis protein CheW [Gammaproteobacteria bacterium]
MANHSKSSDKKEIRRVDLSKLMPHDDISRQLLRDRAELLAKMDERDKDQPLDQVSYIKFIIGANEKYGVPFDEMLDVKLADHITKVPMAPDYVVGISYWHGKLIPVIDLAEYLNFSKLNNTDKPRFIATVENDKTIVGILFDDVVGVDKYKINSLDKNINVNPKVKDTYVYGIHDGCTTILNVKNIIQVITTELSTKSGG